MSDDLLARAAKALRDSHDGASATSRADGDRIVAMARGRSRTARKWVTLASAFAALLALTSAWAASTGRVAYVARWMGRRTQAPELGPRTEPTAQAPATPPASESPTVAPAEVPAALPPHPLPSAVAAAARAAPVAPSPTASSIRPEAPEPDTGSAEEALYAAAHHAHFVTRDPAQALDAWNAYLREYPDGRFALEARYNRALSLVRLGRLDEARAALGPFASGAAGGYRQRESQELLDAMGPEK